MDLAPEPAFSAARDGGFRQKYSVLTLEPASVARALPNCGHARNKQKKSADQSG